MVSQGDLLSLHISELNFAKKCRGNKPSQQQNIIPVNITRVSETLSVFQKIFDLTAKITPPAAAVKLELHILVKEVLSGIKLYLMN